jgi:predicted PurR-regulated permease PerM
MTAGGDQDPARTTLSAATIDLAIRLGFIALLGYWSFRVIAPFLTIGLWSAILAVALYPLFDWLAQRLSPRAAAALVTLLSLLVVVGPVTWLGLGMIAGVSSLVIGLDTGKLLVPLPSESVKSWPIIGERLHELWSLAAGNMKIALAEVAPMLKPVGVKLLDVAQGALFGLVELIVAILISGFLFTRGPQLVDALGAFLGRVLSHRGKELVQLAGATIRNVSRGVVGIALLQAFLAGAGFLAGGIPAPGVLAFVALLLGIIQIGPGILIVPIIVWSWMKMETTHALIFTAYMVPVGLIDNVLRPFLMTRGLSTPMPVIMVGVIGGTIAFGIVGLFFGPIVLAVAWAVMAAWMRGGEAVVQDNHRQCGRCSEALPEDDD